MAPAAVGALLFAVLWVLLLRSRWRFFPLGRAGCSLLMACAMVACGVLSPTDALSSVNVPTLGLLLGCMLLCGHAEKAGLYAGLARLLGGGGGGWRSLLARVSAVSGAASFLVTNDTACLLLPPIVVRASRDRGAPPVPLLLAVATAANIGSACSPLGNPQNMLIALASGLPFTAFLGAVLVPSLAGLALNGAVVAWAFSREFGGDTEGVGKAGGLAAAAAADAGSAYGIDTSAINVGAAGTSAAGRVPLSLPPVLPPPPPPPPTAAARPLRAALIRAVLAAVLPLLLTSHLHVGLTWTVLSAAALCFALDGEPVDPLLAKADASLLLFFGGLFVCVEGVNKTGLPEAAWALVEPVVGLRAEAPTAAGVAAFVALVAVGSNVVSNVPLVLLLGPKLSGSPAPGAWWLLLAFASTVAGNLTLLGSVANLIVAEVGAREGVEVTFLAYNRVGVASTLAILVAGTPMVWGCAKAMGL